jgi:hypothetical protein
MEYECQFLGPVYLGWTAIPFQKMVTFGMDDGGSWDMWLSRDYAPCRKYHDIFFVILFPRKISVMLLNPGDDFDYFTTLVASCLEKVQATVLYSKLFLKM